MVPLAQLLELQLGQAGDYVATGKARPWLVEVGDDEDEDEDDEDYEPNEDGDDDENNSIWNGESETSLTNIRTARILELTFYHYSENKMDQWVSSWLVPVLNSFATVETYTFARGLLGTFSGDPRNSIGITLCHSGLKFISSTS